MTIDDTNVAASRGEVRIDTDGTLWTRATTAWKQYPQTQYRHVIFPMQLIAPASAQAVVRGGVYLEPIEIAQRSTINKLFWGISTPSGTMRFALYSDNGDTPTGGSKLFDSGNIGSAQPTSATVSYIANPGQYWIAATYSTSAAIAFRGGLVNYTGFGGATFSYRAGSLSSNTISLPSTCPTVSLPVMPALQTVFLTLT